MQNQRLFIWAALAFVLFLNYMAWQRDYPPVAAPETTAAPARTAADELPE